MVSVTPRCRIKIPATHISPSHRLLQFSLSSTAFLTSPLKSSLKLSRHSHHLSHHLSPHLSLRLSHIISHPLPLTSSDICSCVITHSYHHLHHYHLSQQQQEPRIIAPPSLLLFIACHRVIIAALTQHHHHPFQTFMIHSLAFNDRFLNMSSSAPRHVSTKTNLQ